LLQEGISVLALLLVHLTGNLHQENNDRGQHNEHTLQALKIQSISLQLELLLHKSNVPIHVQPKSHLSNGVQIISPNQLVLINSILFLEFATMLGCCCNPLHQSPV
jgi:hypothetical protein